MKKISSYYIQLILLIVATSGSLLAQLPTQLQKAFPAGTTFHQNINYASDSNKKHLLDIYLPEKARTNSPLIVWIHGGGWLSNDKYADMSYMTNTIKGFLDSGYALASIDYRFSTTAPFPAQIQDCNLALQYLYEHAKQYKFNNQHFALIGFSAGGHLASLIGLSHNNKTPDFYSNKSRADFKIKCVLDFYGPSDFIAIASNPDTTINNSRNPVSILLGASPIDRPDLAKRASPVNFIDKYDPPFFIVQGEKDESVPNTQSRLLSSWLTLTGVKNEFIMVPGAPHFGEMFDAEWIRQRLFKFLAANFK